MRKSCNSTRSTADDVVRLSCPLRGTSRSLKTAIGEILAGANDLFEVPAEWCPTFQSRRLYYPRRRHSSPTFAAFVETFRFRSI